MRYGGLLDFVADGLPLEEVLRHTFDSVTGLLAVLVIVRNRAFPSHHTLDAKFDAAKILKQLSRGAYIRCIFWKITAVQPRQQQAQRLQY